MRKVNVVLLAALLVPFSSPWLKAQVGKDGKIDKAEAAKKDLKTLEGTWIVTRQEVNGKDSTSGRLKVVIEGDTYSVYRDGTARISESRLTLDPTQDPKTMDMTVSAGTGKGSTSMAIYRLTAEGNLEICRNDARGKKSEKRPTQFTTKPGVGSGTVLHVLKREEKK